MAGTRMKMTMATLAALLVTVLVSPVAIGGGAGRGAPGPVGALTVARTGDHLVTLRWAPPKKGRATSYVVRAPGTRLTTRRPVVALRLADNNTRYRVTVKAVGTSGPGRARSVKVQSAGTPVAPTTVTAIVTEGAGGQAAVDVRWSHRNWEGRPGRYEVLRNGTRVGLVPAGTTSYRDQVPYDGATHTYAVRAINDAGRTSGTAPAAPVVAARLPDAPEWTAAEATGDDRGGHFVFRVGNVRGPGSTYRLVTAGGTYTGAVSDGQTVDVSRRTGENGADVVPTVAVCTAQGPCSTTVPGPVLRPYGPLSAAAISSFGTTKDATRVGFTATVDTNGRPASVTMTGNRGYSRGWTVDGRAVVLSDWHEVGYATDETFTIQIADGGRGSATRSDTSPTTDGRPPEVLVSKGSVRNVATCTNSNCRYIVTETRYFPGNVSCTANSSLGNGGFVAWTQGGNATREGPNIFGQPGGWVEVTCNGVTRRTYW